LPGLQLSAGGLKAFPRQFEAYFQDRLPYRQRVLALHNQFKIDALGASPSPNIIIGKEGHLYYTDFPPGQDRQALQPFSAAELKEWRDLFQARHDALAKHGIHYLVVIAPDKQTIYPDFLPEVLRSRTPKQSRFDELLLHMRAHSTVSFLDLRPVLREGRKVEEVYYRADSHWNAAGGYLGYGEILRALQKWLPDLQPLDREELDYVYQLGAGDLTKMIGAVNAPKEHFPDHFQPKQPRARFNRDRAASPFVKVSDLTHVAPMFSESDAPNAARLVMLHDSFGGQLLHLLAHHFRRVDFVPTHRMPRDMILAERPTVVVQEMVERLLLMRPPADEPAR
jgi:alginate O-acetyltransferase complex protein AlgJ